MSIIGSTQFLERIQFFNGERLFASDLQALEAFNREMRWLHNQSLHQAGVGSGFQVVGNVGDRQVTISPGYAIDSCGREIILTETQVLAIPPVADNGSGGSVFYDLTVSYPDDTELKPTETRAGTCLPTGVIRLREEPVFCWVRLSDDMNHQPKDQRLKDRIKTGLFIVLAQVEIFNCQLKQPVSTVPRRNARPPKQPRIACGTFTPTPKDWQAQGIGGTALPIPVSLGSGGLIFPAARIYTEVDTSSGLFQATPTYTVRLSGNRIENDAPLVPTNYWILDGLVSVSQSPAPTSQSFWVDIFPVIAVVVVGTADRINVDSTLFQNWQITWMGVEG
jgi:hypothetical protein